MLFKCLVFTAVAFLGFANFTDAKGRAIPDYIHICKRTDPQVARCVKESVEALQPRLKSGIAELNVPSIDPLYIDEIEIFRGNDASRFKAYLRNVNVYGAGDFSINKIKLNVDKVTYRVDVLFPEIILRGDYEVDARFLVVPIKGSGTFNATVSNCAGRAVLKGELIQFNGHRQLNFTDFNFNILIGAYQMHLDNLFDGDKVLGQAANEALNQGDFIEGALPFIQNKTAEIFLSAANKITDDLDYDVVFPA